MRCSAPIGGKRYLVEDLAKECYTPEHYFFLVVGIIKRRHVPRRAHATALAAADGQMHRGGVRQQQC
jgi:hypothetical protein